MKKVIATLLSFALCLSFPTLAFATESTTFTNADDAFVHAWSTLRDNGKLKVDDDGLLYISEDNVAISISGYDLVVDMIDICNNSIKDGILIVNAETLEISSTIQPEEEQVPYGLTNHVDKSKTDTRNGAHGCSVQALDLLTMCENNYKTLADYYEEMLRLSLVNPNLSPWGATAGFWIGKVEPNGDWDYKTRPGFSPWYTEFCCNFDGSFQHVTSEYIGNFNYGYTGSYLFSLDVLHFGSSAVAGFDPADEEDWPAIDAGYENATN